MASLLSIGAEALKTLARNFIHSNESADTARLVRAVCFLRDLISNYLGARAMKNEYQRGDIIDYTAGSNIASGAVVKMSHMIGIAVTDIANGATGAVQIEGVFEVPKVPGAVFAVGEKLLWDVSAGQFDDAAATPASGDVMGGVVAVKAGLNAETTALVKLTPGNATLT